MSDELKKYNFMCGALEENIKGDTVSLFKGGCGKNVALLDSYRCADCTASFHRDCLRKHFGTDQALSSQKEQWIAEIEKIREKEITYRCAENERIGWILDDVLALLQRKE